MYSVNTIFRIVELMRLSFPGVKFYPQTLFTQPGSVNAQMDGLSPRRGSQQLFQRLDIFT